MKSKRREGDSQEDKTETKEGRRKDRERCWCILGGMKEKCEEK